MFFYLDVVPGSSLAQRVSCLRRWLNQACPMSVSVSTRNLVACWQLLYEFPIHSGTPKTRGLIEQVPFSSTQVIFQRDDACSVSLQLVEVERACKQFRRFCPCCRGRFSLYLRGTISKVSGIEYVEHVR